MMLVVLWISLAIAMVPICLSLNTNEEIVKVAGVVAVIACLFFSLVFAPLLVKLLILVALLVSSKLTSSIIGKYILSSSD